MLVTNLCSAAADIQGSLVVGETLAVNGADGVAYPEFGLERVEAEDMYTSGYYTVEADAASGGKYVKGYANQPERGGVWCMAAFRYRGKSTKCSVKIAYPDYFSGASPKHLYINGERIAMWSGKLTYGTSQWGTKPEFNEESLKIKRIDDVMLRDGDVISFVSKPDYGEYAELDYIELTRSSGGSGSGAKGFDDIKNDVNKDKINALLDAGILTLPEDNTFNPDAVLKYDEFANMLVKTLGYKSIVSGEEYWAQPYIDKLNALGYAEKTTDFSEAVTANQAKAVLERIEYSDFTAPAGENILTRSEGAVLLYDMREYLEQKKSGAEQSETEYDLDPQGYITTWLYTGGVLTHVYEGNEDAASVMPQIQAFPVDVTIPDNENFSLSLDNGMDFNVLPMGGGSFITDLLRGGDPQLGFSLAYACCDIIAEEACTVNAKIMAARGYYDIYLNGERVTDLYWFWSRSTDKTFTLNLQKGTNRLFMRMQNVLANIIPTNVGIQILNKTDIIKTTVPEQKDVLASVNGIEDWAYGMVIDENGSLKAAAPPETGAMLQIGGKYYDWPLYSDTFDFKREYGGNVVSFKIKAKVGDNYIERDVNLPQNYEVKRTSFTSLEEHQKNYRQALIDAEKIDWDWSEYVLLRLNEGYELNDTDITRIRATIDKINPMNDCAEFAMVHLLRLYKLYGSTFPQDLQDEIKACILNFGYFSDEDGTASMVMTSENHKIGFYSCQYIAGAMYPDEIFTRSGRTGKKQTEIALERLEGWISNVETQGFEEFGSPDYLDITLNAMLNCYDFVDNSDVKSRIKTLIDLQLRTAAAQAFDGASVGANARVYTNALMYPMQGEKSKILSYLSTSMNICEYTQQILGLATSSYIPPSDLEDLITGDVDVSFLQGGSELNIKKTKDYILSSLTNPTPATGTLAANYGKGMLLYQTHIWEASLGAKTRVFVTHPGATSESSTARPAYWYGEYYAPASGQDGNTFYEIYNIPSTNGIQFTHAYFTTDDFDSVQTEEHWLFGKKNSGYVALWCSTPLEKNSDLTIGMEYIARGLKTAWVCMVSSESESGSFEEFIEKCKSRNPEFSETNLRIHIDGKEVFSW